MTALTTDPPGGELGPRERGAWTAPSAEGTATRWAVATHMERDHDGRATALPLEAA